MLRALAFLLSTATFVTPAKADEATHLALESFGLLGSWADNCFPEATRATHSFRVIVAEPDSNGSTYTTVTLDNGVRTTIRSVVLSAVPMTPQRLRLRLRVIGGDVYGGPLPNPTTNTFEQTVEKVSGGTLQIAGNPPIVLRPCRE